MHVMGRRRLFDGLGRLLSRHDRKTPAGKNNEERQVLPFFSEIPSKHPSIHSIDSFPLSNNDIIIDTGPVIKPSSAAVISEAELT
jgi:hypothetical protein